MFSLSKLIKWNITIEKFKIVHSAFKCDIRLLDLASEKAVLWWILIDEFDGSTSDDGGARIRLGDEARLTSTRTGSSHNGTNLQPTLLPVKQEHSSALKQISNTPQILSTQLPYNWGQINLLHTHCKSIYAQIITLLQSHWKYA
jgi:hypothetical protein